MTNSVASRMARSHARSCAASRYDAPRHDAPQHDAPQHDAPQHDAPRSRTRRSGITLVEVLISIIMIAIGVVGLLGSSASVATQMGGGVRQTVAAAIAQARIDSLTSIACSQLAVAGVASGTSLNRGITETWSVTDGKNVKTIVVQITIPKRANKLNYSTVIPCRD